MLCKKYKIFKRYIKFKQLSHENKFLYFKRDTIKCYNCKFNSLHGFECKLYKICNYQEVRMFCLKLDNFNFGKYRYKLDKIISDE